MSFRECSIHRMALVCRNFSQGQKRIPYFACPVYGCTVARPYKWGKYVDKETKPEKVSSGEPQRKKPRNIPQQKESNQKIAASGMVQTQWLNFPTNANE